MRLRWVIVMGVIGLAEAVLSAVVAWNAFKADGLTWHVPAGVILCLMGLWFVWQSATIYRDER